MVGLAVYATQGFCHLSHVLMSPHPHLQHTHTHIHYPGTRDSLHLSQCPHQRPSSPPRSPRCSVPWSSFQCPAAPDKAFIVWRRKVCLSSPKLLLSPETTLGVDDSLDFENTAVFMMLVHHVGKTRVTYPRDGGWAWHPEEDRYEFPGLPSSRVLWNVNWGLCLDQMFPGF